MATTPENVLRSEAETTTNAVISQPISYGQRHVELLFAKLTKAIEQKQIDKRVLPVM